MDSTNTPTNSSNTECATFLATYRRHQTWSLPDSVIYYITKKPSTAEAYEKMIQSCKYFFVQNPILIIPRLGFSYVDNKWGIYFNKGNNVTKISCKIWITTELLIRQRDAAVPFSMSSVISMIYQSDIKFLYSRSQIMYFNELIFLASKCEMIHLSHVNILDENGCTVALEKITEMLPNVKNLFYAFSDNTSTAVTSKTVPELLKIPHFSSIVCFHLRNIPEAFDIEVFYNSFIKKNNETEVHLDYRNPISEAYKNRLQKIVNDIYATKNHTYKSPFFSFPETVF